VRRSSISFVLFFVACGPSVDGPVEQPTGDGSSGAAASGDASTSASSASGGLETSSSAGSSSSGAEETAEAPDELAPAAAGEWLCTGWEDPIYLRLEVGEVDPWQGIACGPDLSGNPPHQSTNCDELGFGHSNLTGTQAYWVFDLDYTPIGGEVVAIDLGVDYVPETDTLEGFILIDAMGGFQPETCVRYEP
jgi:hypothetical protein